MPLRILHVVPYYEQAWAYGGIPRLTTTITRALARRGHDVTVCTTDVCDRTSRAVAVPSVNGITVKTFPNLSNRIAYHLQVFTPVGFRRYLRDEAETFDVAHLHACYHLPGVIAGWELTRAGVPYVVSPNGTAKPLERRIKAKQLFGLTVGRSMLPHAKMVVGVSQAEVTELQQLGIDSSRIVHIPNPIDESEFAPSTDAAAYGQKRAATDAPVILFLGKLTPRKGVEDLVRAFAMIDDRRARLIIAGNDMGAGNRIFALVQKLELQARVTRAGLLTGSDRVRALAAATVVVYPSRDEIFGLVPLEALLAGTPVVVCNDSGCGEVISSTGGGLTVPPGDTEALRSAIEAIVASADRWRERARAAAVVIRRRFGADVVCDQLESLYWCVIAGRFTTDGMWRTSARVSPRERRGDRGAPARTRGGESEGQSPSE